MPETIVADPAPSGLPAINGKRPYKIIDPVPVLVTVQNDEGWGDVYAAVEGEGRGGISYKGKQYFKEELITPADERVAARNAAIAAEQALETQRQNRKTRFNTIVQKLKNQEAPFDTMHDDLIDLLLILSKQGPKS